MTDHDDGPSGVVFWVTGAIGMAVVVVALTKLRSVSSPRSLESAARFVLGAGLAHDAVWAPLGVAAGVATLALPPWARGAVRLGLAFTALTLVFTWPEVRGYGARSNNPSLLPLDYGHNLIVVLALVWAAVLAGVVVQVKRHRAAP